MSCIRCGSDLIANPTVHHWKHCPNCDPDWAKYAQHITNLMLLHAYASAAVSDKRGTPRRNPTP